MDIDLAIGLSASGWAVRRDSWPASKMACVASPEEARLVTSTGELAEGLALSAEDIGAEDWNAAFRIGELP